MPHPAEDDLLRAIERHLSLWDDPAALYATYAADAPLCVRSAIVPARSLAAAEFATLVGAATRVLAKAGRRLPSFEPPTLVEAHGDAGLAVAWFKTREAQDGTELLAGAGLVHEGGGWKVHWATLASDETPPAWSFRLGLAQAVGDMAYVEPAGLRALHGWLDVAYYRRFWKPRPAIATLPDARFSCQSSASCCRIGFKVDLPASAQAVLDALPWDEFAPGMAGARLPVLPDGRLELKDHHQACRFLDEHRHCAIHKALGRAIFPVCASFPIRFTSTPDGVAVTTSSACGSARHNLGALLADRAEDIHDRMAMRAQEPAPEVFYLSNERIVDWATFQRAEAELLAALAREDLSIVDRLYLGERALHALLAEPVLPEHRPVAGPKERAELRAYLASFDGQLQIAPGGKPGPIVACRGMRQEQELLALLRNTLFDKGYSFGADLLTAWHVLVFLALVVLHAQTYDPEGVVPPRLLWRIASLFQHQTVFRSFTADAEEAALMWQEFGRPGFGLELLALPVAGELPALPAGGWRQVGHDDADEIAAFLAADPIGNMDLLEALASVRAAGLDPRSLHWYGWREGGRWRALASTRGSINFCADDPAMAGELATFLAPLAASTPFVRGVEPVASAVFAALEAELGPASDRHSHVALALPRGAAVAADPAFRVATLADLERVVALDRAFLREEVGYDPLDEEPEAFRSQTVRRIEHGRVFLLEEDGEILYLCYFSAHHGGAATISNTYTPPELRGRGHAKRGLRQACRLLHERFEQVVFFTRHNNAAQLAVGRAVGFGPLALQLHDAFWH